MLSKREEQIKYYMENCFVPALHKVVKGYSEESKRKYEMYNGNLCRQTAIFGATFLQNVLAPEYEWTVWEGDFEDKYEGKDVRYQHAWIFGKSPNGERLLLDLSNQVKERLFIKVKVNGYPKQGEHKHMRELGRMKLNHNEMFAGTDVEYMTQISSPQLMKLVIEEMGNTNDEKCIMIQNLSLMNILLQKTLR